MLLSLPSTNPLLPTSAMCASHTRHLLARSFMQASTGDSASRGEPNAALVRLLGGSGGNNSSSMSEKAGEGLQGPQHQRGKTRGERHGAQEVPCSRAPGAAGRAVS